MRAPDAEAALRSILPHVLDSLSSRAGVSGRQRPLVVSKLIYSVYLLPIILVLYLRYLSYPHFLFAAHVLHIWVVKDEGN